MIEQKNHKICINLCLKSIEIFIWLGGDVGIVAFLLEE